MPLTAMDLDRFQKFTRASSRVWLRILVANLGINSQDLVVNAENLGALAPKLGPISCPGSIGEQGEEGALYVKEGRAVDNSESSLTLYG